MHNGRMLEWVPARRRAAQLALPSKSLFCNILHVTPFFAIFCKEKCGLWLTNSFASNILPRSIQKSRDSFWQGHENSGALDLPRNLFSFNILRTNALYSIFCRRKMACEAYISCRFNILRSEIQKHRESFWSQSSSPATL